MDDADFVCGLYTDPLVCRFLGGVKPAEVTRQKVAELADHQRRHGFSRWSVLLKSSGELIGRCGPMVKQIGGASEVELGYSFARDHWGQGYATEAASAALHHSSRVLAQRRVVAIIDPENRASIRVAEKIGMTCERPVEWEGVTVNLFVAQFLG
jgi:ribosomal-protein-alanine N-acetyltransferase